MRKTQETEAWERAMQDWDSAEHALDELLARIRNDNRDDPRHLSPEERPSDDRA